MKKSFLITLFTILTFAISCFGKSEPIIIGPGVTTLNDLDGDLIIKPGSNIIVSTNSTNEIIIATTNNYEDIFVKKSGDTMTGELIINNEHGLTVTNGPYYFNVTPTQLNIKNDEDEDEYTFEFPGKSGFIALLDDIDEAISNLDTNYVHYVKDQFNRYTAVTLGSRSETAPNNEVGKNSVVIGTENIASGTNSFAQGEVNVAFGINSHAEGYGSQALGDYSHAEGSSVASGIWSHSEGVDCSAIGYSSHAEGIYSDASGDYSHADGIYANASDDYSYVWNGDENNSDYSSHGVGTYNINPIDGINGFWIGNENLNTIITNIINVNEKYVPFIQDKDGNYTAVTIGDRNSEYEIGINSMIVGTNNAAEGINSFAQGQNATALGNNSHAEGRNTLASNSYSHAEGGFTKAIGPASHAEGANVTAIGQASHAEGFANTKDAISAEGDGSHAEGYSGIGGTRIRATGKGAHAEGNGNTLASGKGSHVEGCGSFQIASGEGSHAEGNNAMAFGNGAHAENGNISVINNDPDWTSGADTQYSTPNYNRPTIAQGNYSHAEGGSTMSSGTYAHAQGTYTTASGIASHSEGTNTIASGNYSHAAGKNTVASHELSYTWSGQATKENKYESHGIGTFNIDPINGIQGFWIGDTNLYDHIINVAGGNDQYASKTWTSNNFLSLDEGGTVHGSITMDTESDAEFTAGTIYANNIFIDDIMSVNYGEYVDSIGIYVDTDVDANLTANKISLSDNVIDIGYDDDVDVEKGYIDLNEDRIYEWNDIVDRTWDRVSTNFASTNWIIENYATTNWVTNNFTTPDWVDDNFLSLNNGGTVNANVNIGGNGNNNSRGIVFDKSSSSIRAGTLASGAYMGVNTLSFGTDNSVEAICGGAIGNYISIDSSTGCSVGFGNTINIHGNNSFAVGDFLNITGQCSVALGHRADTTNEYTFIWGSQALGDNPPRWKDHGPNTFNIQPTYTINGVYIGDTSFKDCIMPPVRLLRCSTSGTYHLPDKKDNQKVINYYIDIANGVVPVIDFPQTPISGTAFRSRIELYHISYTFNTTGSQFCLGSNPIPELSVLNKLINLKCYYDKENSCWLITSNIEGLAPIVYHPGTGTTDSYNFITDPAETIHEDSWMIN